MSWFYRTLVVLQPTSFCNIDCRYCYLPERALSKRMSIEVIRRIATEVFTNGKLESPFVFLWHLGEPLAVPVSFYEHAFAEIEAINQTYQREYSLGFQTNATLLNEQWIELIKKHKVQIGISLDGPAFIHDRQRVTRSGQGTHEAVMRGVDLLQAHNIRFSVISVLTDYTLDYPDEYFHFFQEHGIDLVGYNLDEIEGIHTSTSFAQDLAAKRYKDFLSRLLQLADETHGAVKFREVWTNLRNLALGTDEPYNTTNQPLRILNFDAQGNFSTFCPELVSAASQKYGDFIMGNILHNSINDLFANPVYQQVHREIEDGVAQCKQSCPYWIFCGGGAPSNKFFEFGRFDVSETTNCRIHKKATVDVLLDFLDTKMGEVPSHLLSK